MYNQVDDKMSSNGDRIIESKEERTGIRMQEMREEILEWVKGKGQINKKEERKRV